MAINRQVVLYLQLYHNYKHMISKNYVKNSVTKRIKPNSFLGCLSVVSKALGFPRSYEELTIYLSNDRHVAKIIVKSNLGIDFIYRDKQKNILASLSLHSSDLKNLLYVLSSQFGTKGSISISPVFEFINERNKESIKFTKESLIGPIVTVLNADEGYGLGGLLKKNVFESEQNVKSAGSKEVVIDFDISVQGVLNTNIISYIERNGIFLSRNRAVTYREILKNKSNDYRGYEELFQSVTGHELLGKTSLPAKGLRYLNSIKVSIIIPCFNSEDTINLVLLSINAQKVGILFSSLEVILVDDASVNPIANFVKKSAFPFSLQIIRLEKNCGASTARHVGTTYAHGDILIFQDSDILLSENYLHEHIMRNTIIRNAVFVSFKENKALGDPIFKESVIKDGLPVPDYSRDLRISKVVKKNAVGSYDVTETDRVEILESTNYFKSFSGSRVFGVYDLSCMVISHNFSVRKETILDALPFSREFKGWGMEDVYLGLKLICNGNFIIPVLSTGVYHIDHPPRSGSEKKKRIEYKMNTEKINSFLDAEVTAPLYSLDVTNFN